jgi:hypothetical protein
MPALGAHSGPVLEAPVRVGVFYPALETRRDEACAIACQSDFAVS